MTGREQRVTMTADKAFAGAGVAGIVAEIGYPLSEIIAALAVDALPALASVEMQIGLALRLSFAAIVGAVVYYVPNRARA